MGYNYVLFLQRTQGSVPRIHVSQIAHSSLSLQLQGICALFAPSRELYSWLSPTFPTHTHTHN